MGDITRQNPVTYECNVPCINASAGIHSRAVARDLNKTLVPISYCHSMGHGCNLLLYLIVLFSVFSILHTE